MSSLLAPDQVRRSEFTIFNILYLRKKHWIPPCAEMMASGFAALIGSLTGIFQCPAERQLTYEAEYFTGIASKLLNNLSYNINLPIEKTGSF